MRREDLFGIDKDGLTLIKLRVGFKEMTVGEIRAWLKASGLVSGDAIEATLFADYSLPDLLHLTTLTDAEIDLLPPSEIHRAFAFAKEVNPDFFEMRQRVVALGRQALSIS